MTDGDGWAVSGVVSEIRVTHDERGPRAEVDVCTPWGRADIAVSLAVAEALGHGDVVTLHISKGVAPDAGPPVATHGHGG